MNKIPRSLFSLFAVFTLIVLLSPCSGFASHKPRPKPIVAPAILEKKTFKFSDQEGNLIELRVIEEAGSSIVLAYKITFVSFHYDPYRSTYLCLVDEDRFELSASLIGDVRLAYNGVLKGHITVSSKAYENMDGVELSGYYL